MNTFLELTNEEEAATRGGFDPASALLVTLTTFLVTNWSQMKSGFADGVLDGYNKVQSL